MRAITAVEEIGIEIDRVILNDTGSNVLSLFQTNLTVMEIPPVETTGPNSYWGWSNPVSVETANGVLNLQTLTIELQL